MAPKPEASAPASSPTVAILGCGAVGSALAAGLARAGVPLLLWSRTPERAHDLERRLATVFDLGDPGAPDGGGRRVRCVERAAQAATAVEGEARWSLLCVSDAALGEFVDQLAAELAEKDDGRRANVARHGDAVFHTLGARGSSLLAPLAALGFAVGKLHPLVALPPGESSLERCAQVWSGAWFATSGTHGALAGIEQLVGWLGAHQLATPDEDSAAERVHAAAALLSGGLVALFDTALGALVAEPSLVRAQARAALGHLLSSTVHNLEGAEPADALTGPTARGAADVVQRHLESLRHVDPEAAAAYRLLARRMLALAAERGRVDGEIRARLERLFAD